jgi:hypothetical protein
MTFVPGRTESLTLTVGRQGGEGTGNEMCMGFFDYYPKNDLVVCAAFYQTGGYINAIGLPASQSV